MVAELDLARYTMVRRRDLQMNGNKVKKDVISG